MFDDVSRNVLCRALVDGLACENAAPALVARALAAALGLTKAGPHIASLFLQAVCVSPETC